MDHTNMYYLLDSLAQKRIKKKRAAKKELRIARVIAKKEKDFAKSEEMIRTILESNSNFPEGFYELALIQSRQKKHHDAARSLLESLALKKDNAGWHYVLGEVLRKTDDIKELINDYLNIVLIEDTDNLAVVLEVSTTTGWALIDHLITKAKINAKESQEGMVRQLLTGHLLMLTGDALEAELWYLKASDMQKDDPIPLEAVFSARLKNGHWSKRDTLIGDIHFTKKRYHKAVRAYTRTLHRSGMAEAIILKIAETHFKLRDYDHCAEICEHFVKTKGASKNSDVFRLWVSALIYSNRANDAYTIGERYRHLLPEDVKVACENRLWMPLVYESNEEISKFTTQLESGLRKLEEGLADIPQPKLKQTLNGLSESDVIFFLSYLGRDNFELIQRHGQLITKLINRVYPKWSVLNPGSIQDETNKIRVGYISNNFGHHPVSILFTGWLDQLDSEKFDTFVYDIGDQNDFYTKRWRDASNKFVKIPYDLDSVCEEISLDCLDILVFFEVGASSVITMLAGCRLAPVQCATWGIPMTTGMPNVDYFLSNELMEPSNSIGHYTERLVKLSGTGITASKPFIPAGKMSRKELRLPDDKVIFLIPQTPRKFLPQYDWIYAYLAEQLPDALFVIINSSAQKHLTPRLEREFSERGLKLQNHVIFIKHLSYFSYLEYVNHADVFLDTIGYSGLLTTWDALACGIPVVTYKGPFMRSRQSYGLLKRMGVTETIAHSLQEYIDIAVRIGNDNVWRRKIGKMIEKQNACLYNDTTCIRDLEKFYQTVIKKSGNSISMPIEH